jgi:23S rRNA pseudouridine1911/1915/1917 synthase
MEHVSTPAGQHPAGQHPAGQHPAGQHRALPVPDGLEGQRIDQALSRLFGLSRTAAAEVADAGSVVVDGRVRGKGDRLTAGSWLEVELPPPPGEPAPPRPVEGMTVLYDDDDVVVVDKPVGVAAHPSPGWDGPTVVGGLAAAGYLVSTSGAAERQGVVHRLDAATTGVMVVAKSERAYTALKAAFKERTVDKRYHALVQGHPDPSRGTIDAPIDRHPTADWRFAVVSGGRPSVTHYEVMEAFRAASLVDVTLETGRTHQIRVHFSALRHPCVGDLAYGADPALAARLGVSRQWLHAVRLGFAHPADGRWIEVASEYPADLAGALAVLRAEA